MRFAMVSASINGSKVKSSIFMVAYLSFQARTDRRQ
jgi:hypothetical protein